MEVRPYCNGQWSDWLGWEAESESCATPVPSVAVGSLGYGTQQQVDAQDSTAKTAVDSAAISADAVHPGPELQEPKAAQTLAGSVAEPDSTEEASAETSSSAVHVADQPTVQDMRSAAAEHVGLDGKPPAVLAAQEAAAAAPLTAEAMRPDKPSSNPGSSMEAPLEQQQQEQQVADATPADTETVTSPGSVAAAKAAFLKSSESIKSPTHTSANGTALDYEDVKPSIKV